jgi:hypothetical protein
MTDVSIVELEDFALELAHTAGGIAQAHFRRAITVENKGVTAFDPVTNADRAIERVLRAAIVERYRSMASSPRKRGSGPAKASTRGSSIRSMARARS